MSAFLRTTKGFMTIRSDIFPNNKNPKTKFLQRKLEVYLLFKKIRSKSEQLTQEIKFIEAELANLPNGKLICAKTGNYTK